MQEKHVINCIKPSLYLLVFAKNQPEKQKFHLVQIRKIPKTLLTLIIYEYLCKVIYNVE